MSETTRFILFTAIATVIVCAVVVWNRSAQTSRRAARAFYILCLLLSCAALISTILVVSGVLPAKTYSVFRRALSYPGWLIIGAGVSSAVLMPSNAFGNLWSRITSEAVQSFICSPYLLKGLCLSVSLSFLAIEIGKLAHDAEMRQFFMESGYTVWFMYLIMAAETLGALGLFVSKAILPAALGLAAIMLGAIYTHYRNGDPFSDSSEAFYLLILLACIIVNKSLRSPGELKKGHLNKVHRNGEA